MYKNNKKTQINNMRDKKRDITRDKTELKNIIITMGNFMPKT